MTTRDEAIAATEELNPDSSVWTPMTPRAEHDLPGYELRWSSMYGMLTFLDYRDRCSDNEDGFSCGWCLSLYTQAPVFGESYAEAVKKAVGVLAEATARAQDLAAQLPASEEGFPSSTLWERLRE